MTGAAAALLWSIAEREPILNAAVDDTDPLELGRLAVMILGWPALPGAARALYVDDPRFTPGDESYTAGPSGRCVSPLEFVRALVQGHDQEAAEMAPDVDVLALAVQTIVFLSWPPLHDPVPWLDRLEVLSWRDVA